MFTILPAENLFVNFYKVSIGHKDVICAFILANILSECYLETMNDRAENNELFSSADVRQMMVWGLRPQDVKKQLALYRRGPFFLRLKRPCVVDDGIVRISSYQRKKLIAYFEKESPKFKLLKFVPASGAASRMFAAWYQILENKECASPAFEKSFFEKLKKYPFYDRMKREGRVQPYLVQKDIKALLHYILSKNGLNYGGLPKALIPFHLYAAGQVRTALEEHLIEAVFYLRDTEGICRLHFTVSPEHQKEVVESLKKWVPRYERKYQVKYDISTSIQAPFTNVLAVDENNMPLRDASGQLIFRPGGHGSLLRNLQQMDADFIFIKNIDNVAHERLLKKNLPYKKILGGLALRIREEIFSFLQDMDGEHGDGSNVKKIQNYCRHVLHVVFPKGFTKQPLAVKKKILFSILDRPLRVCAMVRNNGEPGGAPFWVEEKDGRLTLQIVESAQVHKNDRHQSRIWSAAEYFNPVDMVCSIKNYQGRTFHLEDFVNPDAYLITQKNEKGRFLRALEYPGLWNGSMAYWNTIFVEMPLMIFNPVKTIDDLLRKHHRAR